MEGRFQTLAAREQCLFGPDSPVWVSRWRLSRDGETRRLLLQVRLVNLSEKNVRRVFLRILCRGEDGRLLRELCLLPMAEVSAAPGCQFGDDCPLELAVPGTREVEIYAQRVIFSDAGAWDEKPGANYIAFRPARRLLPSEGDYARLTRRAKEGGVGSAFRFRALSGLWLCTCGLPNADRRLTCARCGADREWLEANLYAGPSAPRTAEDEASRAARTSPFAPDAGGEGTAAGLASDFAAAPAPDFAAAPAPDFAAAVPMAIGTASLGAAPLGGPASLGAAPLGGQGFPGSVIPAPPMPAAPASAKAAPRAAKPAREEETPPPPPPELEAKAGRGGKLVLILLIVLAVLAAAACAAYALGKPYFRYRAALDAQQSGDYARAQELFEELEDYRDSAERARQCVAGEAVEKMNDGKFEEALAILEELEGFDEEKAKCLYSIAVLAHNDGQLDKAWEYIRRLETLDAAYKDLPELRRSCNYARGLQIYREAVDNSRSQKRIEQLNQAIEYFTLAEGYEKSETWIAESQYLIACEERRLADSSGMVQIHLERAIPLFEALGDYKDSVDRLLDCKYRYAEYFISEMYNFENETALAYLEELLAADYPGAEELQAMLTAETYSFIYVTDDPDVSDSDPELWVYETSDLSGLYVHFPNTRVPLLLKARYPDGNSAIAYLNYLYTGEENTGVAAWEDLFHLADCTTPGEVTLELYNAAQDYREALVSYTITLEFEPPAPTGEP